MPPTSETAQLRVDQSLLQPSVRVFILFNLDIDSSVFHLANYSNMRISACRPTAGFIRSQTRYLHLKSSNDALYTLLASQKFGGASKTEESLLKFQLN